jgi:hypothetical protein
MDYYEEDLVRVLRASEREVGNPHVADMLGAVRQGVTRRRRIRVLAGAAAVAVAVLAAVMVGAPFRLANRAEWAAGSYPPSPTPVPSASAHCRPAWPSNPPMVAMVNAGPVLDRLAAIPGPAPVHLPLGHLMYVRSTGPGRQGDQIHEMWVDVNGNFVMRIRTSICHAQDMDKTYKPTDQDNTERRNRLASQGPNLDLATPYYLAGLPTDPDAMLALLRNDSANARGGVADFNVFRAVDELLSVYEPILTPAVRASLYRALGRLSGVAATSEPIDVGGRKVYVVSMTEASYAMQLLFDPTTGRVVGDSTGSPPMYAAPLAYAFWQHTVVAGVTEDPPK